jgi:hypothetical protein
MAVEFNAVTDYLKWTSVGIAGSNKRTLLMWINFSIASFPAVFHPVFSLRNTANYSSGTNTDEMLDVYYSGDSAGVGSFSIGYSSTLSGVNAVLTNNYSGTSLSGWKHIAITIDGTSITKYPVLYVNNTVIANPTPVSGSGRTYNTGNNFDLYINAAVASTANTDVEIYGSVCLYNRVLSTSEIADAYANKLAVPTTTGLAFAAQLQGCAGDVGDGGTLSSSNTVANITNGVLGVPNGTVVFRQDAKLTY